MKIIELNHITKDYGDGKGVFDISFSVEKGEVLGFLGPNGAGKTTTIRHLMGFSHPDKGSCSIDGLNCTTESAEIQKKLGYLPGEIAFMDDITGMEFIKFVGSMKGMKDYSRAEALIKKFELNPKGRIKKMSKGMKQKIGIVCAFMAEPEILILDEPTSGLDPLMQNKFVELILEEKAKGTTILMSSHMFEEIERTCDRAAIIKSGKIVAVENISTLKESRCKTYMITLETPQMAETFSEEPSISDKVTKVENNLVTLSIQGDIMPFIETMTRYKVVSLNIATLSLEELFMHYYGGAKND
ncbi:ABC transporter ATP-binding protein [Clostridium cellulovorans]|uniref:ABC transporter related n=1 Tax=Clostridium cellulovorans (strain ATCC 35296 / DSM 3052 / OCM 3 / 743B) TaxID=573061 RepID=D9SQI0_CLOC7|nr:ABC transporter ATP-binding protein [Clostridium cellulovorans]ADL50247.1 ABC transporter related [Clostridium cellulovorans 743B]